METTHASRETGADAPTRERVARTILELGPSTAATLAERLSLTPAAIRRHLDHLVETGLAESREPRAQGVRGRGRPAKMFALTPAGRDLFEQQYDDLAAQALRFLAETAGEQALSSFAERRLADLETRITALQAERPGHDRLCLPHRSLQIDLRLQRSPIETEPSVRFSDSTRGP